MQAFTKRWQAMKDHTNNKRTADEANLSNNAGKRKKLKRKKKKSLKKQKGNSKYTPEKMRIMIKKFNSKPIRHWKQNFSSWQGWCEKTLSMDRSQVADASSERTMIDRFAKPKRYMVYRDMGLDDLRREGLGWDKHLEQRMMIEGIESIEAEGRKGKILKAELPEKKKKKLRLAKLKATQANQQTSNVEDSDSSEEFSLGIEDLDSSSDEEDAEDSDSDVQHIMSVSHNNHNNNNNYINEMNTLSMKQERHSSIPPKISNVSENNRNDNDVMLSSLNNIDDAMFDFAQATGKNIKNEANKEPLFDMKSMMNDALDRMKDQRMKEMKKEEEKDKDMFAQMIDQTMTGMIDNFLSANLKMQLFASCLNAHLPSLFFVWIQTNFVTLVEIGLNIDTFGDKLSKLIDQGDDQFAAFLQKWMLWRTLYADNLREIFVKLEFLLNQEIENLLPALEQSQEIMASENSQVVVKKNDKDEIDD